LFFMKTLVASTPKSGFDLRTQGVSEWPIDAVELTDEDLENVSGSFFGFGGFSPFGFGGFSPFGFGRFGFGGFSPFGFGGFSPFGFGGFSPFGFGGFGFGPSIAINQFAFAGGGWW
jgi:hypothetical protein